MFDLFHEWASDLTIGSQGDLCLVNGTDMINQRICRRLLTNEGEYLWNLEYGGGLAKSVGSPVNSTGLEALIRTQLEFEEAIPTAPAPQIRVQLLNPTTGYVLTTIAYADPSTGAPVKINISTG
jgi:phage baseplate assembly protein W